MNPAAGWQLTCRRPGVYYIGNYGPTLDMSHFVALGALLATLTVKVLFAQAPSLNPRDLYLEKDSADTTAAPAGHHLGFRYTELLVDPSTKRVREVAPDTVFHEGDCLAVEFTPNRNGSLYVLNHGSSGDWHLLIPDPEMPDASSAAQAGATLRVPTDYCFRLDDKPGTEILLLAITEREDDATKMRDLLASSRAASHPTVAVVLTSSTGPAKVDAIRGEVESWQRLGSRDLKIEKIDQPESAGERPNSVYAVMSSAVAANRLVIEIKVHHE